MLTGGNYILGVGLGYRAAEFDSFGIPLKERAPRFGELIQLMRRLWTEERVTHDGRFYSVKDVGISLKPVRPEVRRCTSPRRWIRRFAAPRGSAMPG